MTGTELHLAQRVTRIRTSASLAAAARSRELRAQGRDIIDLTTGEPDLGTPDHVIEAAAKAMRAGQTTYTPVNGTPELREAVIDAMSARTGQTYGHAQVTLGGGAKQVLFLALMATVEAGDEVIVPAPYWVSYPDMALANDATPVVVECPATDGFKLTPAALEAAITPRTRWLVLNSPSNPTGAVYGREELAALAEVLLRHPHVLVMTDDIYDGIHFGTEPVANLVAVEPALADRVLTVNGVSKSYAMTGWRIGYGVGPVPLVAAMNKLVSQITSCPSSVSQAAAVAALTGPQQPVADAVEVYRERRDRTVELLRRVPGLTCEVPDGAFYLFVGCADLIGRRRPDGQVIGSDEDLGLYLLDSVGVATVHGAAYGLSPYVRLSYATSTDLLVEACRRIEQACAALT